MSCPIAAVADVMRRLRQVVRRPLAIRWGAPNIRRSIHYYTRSFSNGAWPGGRDALGTSISTASGYAAEVTHATPSDFDFPLAGSRVHGEFRLIIPNDLRSAMIFTAKSQNSSSTSPPVQVQAFSGVASEAFLHPRVRSEDGATNTFHSNNGAVDVTGNIVVHSAKN